MDKLFKHIKGDKAIWAIVGFLIVFSFLPVYSASTNLVYAVGKGSTLGHLLKHVLLLLSGLAIVYTAHKIPYRYFSGGSVLMLPVVFILLVLTLARETVIEGANASRWLQIPFVGVEFQTSTLASLVMLVYTARYFAKNKEKKIDFKESTIQLWIPLAVMLILILPASFSTTAITFAMILLLSFIGGCPTKHILVIITVAIFTFGIFVLVVKAFPDIMPKNRVQTWENRISGVNNYQIEKAKTAIATGGILGRGFGKGVQKSFLPQSTSDFIYAVIIEETGLIGAMAIVFMYFLLLFRIVIVARKTTTVFSALLVIGVGFQIIFQAIINMAVAVNLLPVTGQNLPLISSGGTSIWITCLALGMILSVSASKNETEESILDDNPLDVLRETI